MNDAIVGGAVTGGFSLVVLVLTLRHSKKQAERAEKARIRERRVDRLRDSYRDFVVGAYAMARHAAVLGIALTMQQQGEGRHVRDVLATELADTREQHAALQLEDDADQAILTIYGQLSMEHVAFLAQVASCLEKGEDLSSDEYKRSIKSMEAKANAIAKLAKERLTELEQPKSGSLAAPD